MYFVKIPLQQFLHFSPSLENKVRKKVLIDPIEQTSQSHRKYLIYVSSGLSMHLLSKVSSHLRERIAEIGRGLKSPPIPLYSSFDWSHLPERSCPKFRRMTYSLLRSLSRYLSSIQASITHLSHQFHIWQLSLPSI